MLSLLRPRPFFAHSRLRIYSLRQISTSRPLLNSNVNTSTPKIKPSPSLVQKLRTQTSCTIQKAIQALQNSENNYEKALEWLAQDQTFSAEQKARKLSGRVTTNGLIGISPLSNGVLDVEGVNGRVGNIGMPLRIGMVEVNCETDFVARSPVFEKLVRDLAWNVGFYAGDSVPNGGSSTGGASKWIQRINTNDLNSLMQAPMLYEPPTTSSEPAQELDVPTSIWDAINNTISLVGEKITLKRAACISAPPLSLPTSNSTTSSALSVGVYAHNSTIPADVAKTVRGSSGTSAGAVLVEVKGQQIINDLAVSVPGQHTGKPELRSAYRALERALARQVVGYETNGIKASASTSDSSSVAENKEKGRDGVEEIEGPTPLYAQPFHTYAPLAARSEQYRNVPLENIDGALKGWVAASGWKGKDESVNVVGFLKWSIGEDEDTTS